MGSLLKVLSLAGVLVFSSPYPTYPGEESKEFYFPRFGADEILSVGFTEYRGEIERRTLSIEVNRKDFNGKMMFFYEISDLEKGKFHIGRVLSVWNDFNNNGNYEEMEKFQVPKHLISKKHGA